MDRSEKKKNRPMTIIRTLLIMYVITGLALLLLALLLLKLQPDENIINIGILSTYVLSCLLGGLIAGKRFGTRKFLWGVLMGAIYFLILLAGSLLMNRGFNTGTVHTFTALVTCMAAGMIGGMPS